MTKRIGVMTFLHNDNYGSTLQAWALQQTLLEMGWDAEHIDYRPSKQEKLRNLLTSGNSPKLIVEGMRKRTVKVEQAGARNKSASFEVFYEQRMNLSAPCRSHADLAQQARQYDTLLCGSDQVWSPVWLNPAYFLDFAAEGQRKVAYAASLGVSTMPDKAKASKIAHLTQGFHAISLREQEGASLICQITGVDYPVMPDPVCLVTRAQWLRLAEMPHRKHPYLVCYFIGDHPSYWERVKAYADRSGLRVKVIPVTENAYRQPFDLADGLSPEQWLGYLAEAAYVCTDSFHGAAFSAILQRPFSVFRRYREDDPESKNSRVDNLMRALALDRDCEDIPWETVSARLQTMRQAGIDWLTRALKAE